MVKIFTILGTCIQIVCLCQGETLNFDNAKPGSPPRGWTVAMTHRGGPPRWEIVADESAPTKPNVLAQVSNDRTAGRFPLLVYDRTRLANGTLSVRFKTISGAVDQAAGLVWRYRDPDN